MKTRSIILLFVFAPLAILSQWSNNPSLNTKIIDTTGTQAIPKVAVNPTNGQSYFSWFNKTEANPNFEIYLQRLDASGNKLWNDEGLLISNHPTWSWVTDYDMIADSEGDAIIVTQDARTGFSDVFAYRISPDGTFEWGTDGIALTNDNNFDPSPQTVVTTDENIVFMWAEEPADTTDFIRINLQKLSLDGQSLWTGNTVISKDTMHCMMPQMIATEDTGVIVVWVNTHSTDTSMVGNWPNMYPMAQKIDKDGKVLWAEPTALDTLDNMPLAFFEVALISDGNNGFFVGWMAFPAGQYLNAYIQHVSSDGTPQWAANGLPVSDSLQYQHTDPSLVWLPQHEEVFVFWNIMYPFVWTEAIYGQKFSIDGQNLWIAGGINFTGWMTDTLIALADIKSASEDDICMFFENEFIAISGSDTTLNNDYYACRINREGATVWGDTTTLFANSTGAKYGMALSELNNGQWIAVWQDCRSNPASIQETGIYAQNIRTNGTLGPLNIGELHPISNLMVSCYPNPFDNNFNVEYEIEQEGNVEISLYDLFGREIRQLFSAEQQPGSYRYTFNGTDLHVGVYIIKLRQNGNMACHKIVKSK